MISKNLVCAVVTLLSVPNVFAESFTELLPKVDVQCTIQRSAGRSTVTVTYNDPNRLDSENPFLIFEDFPGTFSMNYRLAYNTGLAGLQFHLQREQQYSFQKGDYSAWVSMAKNKDGVWEDSKGHGFPIQISLKNYRKTDWFHKDWQTMTCTLSMPQQAETQQESVGECQ